MRRFIERVTEIIRRYPDRIAVKQEDNYLTYKELDERSGKVYSWLRSKGIGAEDFVLILMPRDVDAIAAVFGVMRSGAAFVVMEDFFPSQRVDYIRSDVNAKVVIDADTFLSIMKTSDYLEGYEETDLHQAAFAVYTSGSTGVPKGVLHEYGNIDIFSRILPEKDEYEITTAAMVSPFYFVVTILIIVNCLSTSRTIYIVSMSMVRNFNKFSSFLIENKISSVYLSPSYIRMYKEPSKYLTQVITGSEPANGIYYEGGNPSIQNIYTMSEAGIPVLSCILDRSYEEAPVGYPAPGLDLHLVDEEGNRIEGEGKGEIVFLNPYVRGYINLPEKTKDVFVNGYYHTGDVGRRDKDGKYYIVGRIDDMFKINGNRVEPGEIEGIMKLVTGLTNVVVKGFNEEGHSFICMYFLKAEAQSLGIYNDGNLVFDRNELENKLPRYMIPTYYVGLDEFPINMNGKLVRRELKAPVHTSFEENYVAPSNDLERLICDAMAKVLNITRVGVEDDFYQIGGDSMSSIELITVLGEKGYDITDSDLYNLRTPSALAALCSNRNIEDPETLMRGEKENEDKPQDLLPMQMMWTRICEKHPEAKLRHMPILYRMKADVDVDRLKAAVDKVFDHYPIFKTRIVKDDNGKYVQVYDPGILEPISVETVSDAEFEKIQESLVGHLDMFSGVSNRKVIYRTETQVYLFMHFHHAFFDGSGLMVIRNAIYNCYKDPDYVIPPDYYYYILDSISRQKGEDSYKEAEDHFEKLNKEFEGAGDKLIPDLEGEYRSTGLFFDPTAFTKDKDRTNLFYLACTAIAAARTNKSDKAIVYLEINGRDRFIKNISAGGYATSIPIFIDLNALKEPQEIIGNIKDQVEYASLHLSYSCSYDSIEQIDQSVMYLYQKDIYSLGAIEELVEDSVQLSMDPVQPCHYFGVAVIDNTGLPVLPLSFIYSNEHYSQNKVNEFASNFKEAAAFLGGVS